MWYVTSSAAWTSQCGAALPDLLLLLAMFRFHTVALVSHCLVEGAFLLQGEGT